MASRLITTSFAIVSTAALLGGCDTVSHWFDGSASSGSSGAAHSSATGVGDSAHASAGTLPPAPSATPTDTTASPSYQAGERLSADTVKRAQQALKDQGLYKGRIDGVVGPQTRAAVTRYQRDHQLQQTAILDDATLRALDQRMSAVTR